MSTDTWVTRILFLIEKVRRLSYAYTDTMWRHNRAAAEMLAQSLTDWETMGKVSSVNGTFWKFCVGADASIKKSSPKRYNRQKYKGSLSAPHSLCFLEK